MTRQGGLLKSDEGLEGACPALALRQATPWLLPPLDSETPNPKRSSKRRPTSTGPIALGGTLFYILSFAVGAGPVSGLIVPELNDARVRGENEMMDDE